MLPTVTEKCARGCWTKLCRQPSDPKMRQLAVKASQISYNAAIGACEKGANWEWAVSILANRMLDSITSTLQEALFRQHVTS